MREIEHDVEEEQSCHGKSGAKTDYQHPELFTFPLLLSLYRRLIELLVRSPSNGFAHVYSPASVRAMLFPGVKPDRMLTHDI